MIPLSVMVTGRGTVSFRLKGPYGKDSPARFSTELRPIVFWNITYRCNLNCLHCYISASPLGRPGELTRDEALSVAKELVELGIPLVVLSGGEPLVRGDFWDIVSVLRDGGVKVALSTNGTLVNQEVARKLARVGINYVGISLDSTRPSIHDAFRGLRGAFEKALEGVKNSLDAGLDVGFRMTITKFNVEEAVELVDLARGLGVKRVAYYLIDLTGRARENTGLLPSREQLVLFLDKLIDKAKETGGDPEILLVRGNFAGLYVADRLSRTREEFLAYLKLISAQGDCGRKTISIYPDGKVKPCQFMDWVDIGDLRRERLRDVLNPSNHRLLPFLEIYRNLRGPRCSSCVFKEVCGGGSRGRALALTRDMWGDDPLCIIDSGYLATKWGIAK